MSEPITLVCGRVGSTREADVVTGSVTRNCAFCTANVWLAPSSQAVVATRDAVILCRVCAQLLVDGDIIPDLAPGALQEIRDHLRRR